MIELSETDWTIIIPMTSQPATSREPTPHRQHWDILVMAMALDTVETALATQGVQRVIVVADSASLNAFLKMGATVAANEGGGVNEAVAQVIVGAGGTEAPVAVMVGTLPALHELELSLALKKASAHPLAMVADVAHRSAVLVTATRGNLPMMHPGPGSLSAYHDAGYRELLFRAESGLRRSVYDEDQLTTILPSAGRRTLRAARMLGVVSDIHQLGRPQ